MASGVCGLTYSIWPKPETETGKQSLVKYLPLPPAFLPRSCFVLFVVKVPVGGNTCYKFELSRNPHAEGSSSDRIAR